MARKITHTKRGTMYHGVTGTQKAPSLTDLTPKSSSSKSTKRKSSHTTSYSSGVSSSEKPDSLGCVILSVVAVLFVVLFTVQFCSRPTHHSSRKPRHPKSYYTGHDYMPKISGNNSIINFIDMKR